MTHKPKATETFQCEVCGSVFPDHAFLMQHVENVHEDQSWRCHMCKFITNESDKLEEHKQSSHDSNIVYINCNLCSYKALHESDLRIHQQTFHDNQALVLRALQELTSTVRTLTTDVFYLKTNSIMIEKDMLELIQGNIVSEVNKNVTDKFKKIEPKLTNVKDDLNGIQNAINGKKDSEVIANNESTNIVDDDDPPPKETYADVSKAPAKENSSKPGKKSIVWFGTSISKALDKKKFEYDTNAKLKIVKAYCIQEEGKFPKSNFCNVVPTVLENETADVAVFQTGSIEITNLDVKKAMMDPNKDIKEYEKEWTNKAEKDSEILFNLALEVTRNNPEMEVVILKRLPRFDSKVQDPNGIKSKLSQFANNVSDHLFFKHGCPNNIKITSIELGLESQYLRQIVIGNPDSQSYDGIHLRGSEASRHFMYRAVQSIFPHFLKNGANVSVSSVSRPASHTNCPQARYKRQSQQNHGAGRMSTTKKHKEPSHEYGYNVPTKNSFNVLGNF